MLRWRWSRRLFTISLFTALLALFVALGPLVLVVAVVHDLIRRNRFCGVRLYFFALLYLAWEQVGVWASVLLWIANGGPFGDPRRPAWVKLHFRLQQWWSESLFRTACRMLEMKVEIEGAEESRPAEGPLLVFIRHAGMLDVLLPAHAIANRHHLLLRYVLDASLLIDPCLDIVGHRLGNAYVRRSSRNPDAEINKIVELLKDLAPTEGVLLYPEGARYTPDRHAKVIESMTRRGEHHLVEKARRLKHTMPPKLGGALGLLQNNPGADVIFLAHAGLDRIQQPARLLDGTALGGVIRIKLWRVARREIPETYERQIDWLFEQWEKIDTWVGAQLQANAAPVPAERTPQQA